MNLHFPTPIFLSWKFVLFLKLRNNWQIWYKWLNKFKNNGFNIEHLSQFNQSKTIFIKFFIMTQSIYLFIDKINCKREFLIIIIYFLQLDILSFMSLVLSSSIHKKSFLLQILCILINLAFFHFNWWWWIINIIKFWKVLKVKWFTNSFRIRATTPLNSWNFKIR